MGRSDIFREEETRKDQVSQDRRAEEGWGAGEVFGGARKKEDLHLDSANRGALEMTKGDLLSALLFCRYVLVVVCLTLGSSFVPQHSCILAFLASTCVRS